MPRHNALSPLQAFSPLREEPPPLSFNTRAGRPPTKTSAAPSAVNTARSKSVSVGDLPSDSTRLRRSLNGRERAFSTVRDRPRSRGSDEATGITTRLLLVKAPNEGLHK